MLEQILRNLSDVKAKKPLVQAITNYVTINDCANILLAFGASPAMVENPEETDEFANFISSLYLNVGTLTREQEETMIRAVEKTAALGKPVILDPVACGALTRKMRVIQKMKAVGKISVIKGNIGEIKHMAGFEGKVRGVDSIDDGADAIEACKALARKYDAVVAATGKTDVITDGTRVALIDNGTDMLSLVTGTGCMLGALVAATCGAGADPFVGAVSAVMSMGIAGELAAKHCERPLPGSFRVQLMDAIYRIGAEEVKSLAKLRLLPSNT